MLIAAWSNFLGANQQRHPKRLPEGVGANAVNMRLGFGDFRTWRGAQTVVTTGGATPLLSLYRMNRSVASDTSVWLQWAVDVDVVRTLLSSDPTEEIFYTGDGMPKRTNNVLGLPAAPGPAAWRSLGIPRPTAPMTVALLVEGSDTQNESRAYVDTFVNDQGRESAPGEARRFTCKKGSTTTLSDLDPQPSGYPDLTLRRIYVSVDGSEYRRCAEVSIALTTTSDTGTRGVILETGGSENKPAWLMPPGNLKGLIPLWNNMLGGFFDKTICVSEPNAPWAWPVEYQDTMHDEIVGTGTWLQNWLILTTSTPVVLRGGPELFDKQPIPFNQACVSKRSILGMGYGVCWASPDGLCFMGEGGARILTEGVLSPEQWQALAPSTLIGARYERYYVGFFDNGGPIKGFLIDPMQPDSMIFHTVPARGRFFDPISTRLYLQDAGNIIKRWNHPSAALLDGTWTTPVVRHPQPTNAGFAMLVADEPVDVDFTLKANVLQNDGTTSWETIYTTTATSGEPFSLPSGYMAQDYQVTVVSTGPLQGILLAEDVADMV